ncbi:MAG: DUF432 domain-containing protein [Calditrichia bacterium]
MAKKQTSDGRISLWGDFPLPDNEERQWEVGPFRLHYKISGNELWTEYSRQNSKEGSNKPAQSAENTSWSRFALRHGYAKIRILPVLPDRAVVVKPETAFWISKGAKSRVYVRVPVWVQMRLMGRQPVTILDVSTVVLSNTWFGGFMQGELSYWISSSARVDILPDPSRPHMAICPIQIINNSNSDLLVEKIGLRVPYLSLFYDSGQLWSDEMKISYRGGEAVSSLSVSGIVPPELPGGKLISAPRDHMKKNFAAKTFSSIKDLPGLGIFSN